MCLELDVMWEIVVNAPVIINAGTNNSAFEVGTDKVDV